MVTLLHADCLDVLKTLADNSVDAVVTDPPYGLLFMGNKWDYDVPSAAIWAECLRVMKPGGHLLAFSGTRTQHRMAVRIEDAGFEIRDMIAWVYGTGFPKSHNLEGDWSGWGTALKPALEPITVARKPLIGTIAENVAAHGTGALNIDACRVKMAKTVYGEYSGSVVPSSALGRWPANLIHDGSEEVASLFPFSKAGVEKQPRGTGGIWSGESNTPCGPQYGDSGSAARFFYSAKASKSERDAGCESLPKKNAGTMVKRTEGTVEIKSPGAGAGRTSGAKNHHPTVKPIALMQYLCKLVTPPNGTVLDPFMGSGTTGCAAVLDGFSFIGVEREADYVEIAKARVAHYQQQTASQSTLF